MINFKQYVREQLHKATDEGIFDVAREQLMNDYINSTIGEDIEDNNTLAYPEDEIAAEYQRYLEFVEYLMLNIIMNRSYSTRAEAVDYMIAKGMSEPFAKAAIDQQYNYDENGDTADLLRGNHEDLTIPSVVTREELDMVYDTWLPMLRIEHGSICVDGEPTYDLQGNMLTDDEPTYSNSIVRGYENGGNFS